MTGPTEMVVSIESVRIPHVRATHGILSDLAESIRTEGLHHPITVWTDGTLISGARRLRAHFLLGAGHLNIQAVFVNTIEDAAKRLAIDHQDDREVLPMVASEMCRLWELLFRLDEPAAAFRQTQARRRGVELRRQTQAGKRPPGRANSRTEDYAMAVVSEPFGISGATAARLWRIYNLATSELAGITDGRRDQARKALQDIDEGRSSIGGSYVQLSSKRPIKVPQVAPSTTEKVPAARQRLAWDRSLPQMEGLVAGLVELGDPSPDLTWEQVSPVCARLMNVRRDLEKIIKKMRESNQS